MAIGEGGKYDDLATYVREATGAEVVMVVVIGGTRGSGYAQQMLAASAEDGAETAERIADTLRKIATKVEFDAGLLRLQALQGKGEGEA